jgi:hypothetical protein
MTTSFLFSPARWAAVGRWIKGVAVIGCAAGLLFLATSSAQAEDSAPVTQASVKDASIPESTPPEKARKHHRARHIKHAAKKPTQPESDVACAVHVAYGEARNTSREEEAVVINVLLNRAHREGMSVCRAARRYFKPRRGTTPGIEEAAKNVMEGDKSLVPPAFARATEMRAWHAPAPSRAKFRRLGSVEHKTGNGLHGNVFYEPVK